MALTVAPSAEAHVHIPTADFKPLAPREYLLTLAISPALRALGDELRELGERDEHRGRKSRPWRERSQRELWEAGGHRRRYLQRIAGTVGSVLPRGAKPLALRFILTEPEAMFDFIFDVLRLTPTGPPITDQAAVARLWGIVHRRLEGQTTGPADQKFLERTLRRLDVRDLRIRAYEVPATAPLALGTPVSCSATSATHGSYSVIASSPLMPGAGFVAGWDGNRVLVDPAGA